VLVMDAVFDAWASAFRHAPAPSRRDRRARAGDRRRRAPVAQLSLPAG
jgi:hypothetical protein